MPTPVTRALVDKLKASAVRAEVVDVVLPVSELLLRFRVMAHVDAYADQADAAVRIIGFNPAAAVPGAPVPTDDSPRPGRALVDLALLIIARSAIDDAGELLFTGPADVEAFIDGLESPADAKALIDAAHQVRERFELTQTDARPVDLVDVGKGSSRTSPPSSSSMTSPMSSAVSHPSSAGSPRRKSS